MIRAVALLLALSPALGCGGSTPLPGPLNRAALRASHPRSVRGAVTPVPQFQGVTSSSGMLAAFGLAGLVMMQGAADSEGDRARETGVYDPAVAINVELTKALAKRFSLQITDPSPKKIGRTIRPVEDLSDRNQDVDLLLEVRTNAWGFKPVRIGAYGVTYEGTLRLIDTRSKALIAEGQCTSLPVDSSEAPSYEQMQAQEAALLKEMLRGLEQYCTDDYRKRILGLYGQ